LAAAQFYKPGSHFAPLDGLRGIAILLVIACHVRLENTPIAFDRGMFSAFGFGVHGVDLFFVLSGFLITGILIDSKGSQGFFSTFYLRRTLRIFPLYYLYLILRLLLVPAIVHHFHLPESPLVTDQAHEGFFWFYASNLIDALHPNIVIEGGLFHLWSLAVEEQFYLFWPLLVFFLSTKALARLCGVLIVVAFLMRLYLCSLGHENLASGLTLCRLDALAAGALIAIAVRSRQASLSAMRKVGWALLLPAATTIVVRMALSGWETHENWVTTYGVTLAILCSAGVILLLLGASARTQALCNSKVLRRIGRYSYSMYVFHFVVFRALDVRLTRVHLPTLAGSVLPQQIFDFAVVSAATFLVGMLTWYAFEMWFLRLKGRIPYRPSLRERRFAES